MFLLPCTDKWHIAIMQISNEYYNKDIEMLNMKWMVALVGFIMFSFTSEAQTLKSKTKKTVGNAKVAKTAKAEEINRDELFEDMLSSTAQVMFIDSVVTDRSDCLSKIPLNKQAGIVTTYDKMWKTAGQPNAYVYMNEFENKAIFSKQDEKGHFALYSSDKLNDAWSLPKKITDLSSDFEDINYPYMMSDGVTLYFAAKNKNSLGGYDIYVTMYDTDSARFYKPENIGLPYNSKSDDLFYIVDDFNNIGWLVTDRNQPKGKVCVYTFVPTNSRQAYDEDNVGDKKLRALATIHSIKDTWTDKAKLQSAKARLQSLQKTHQALDNNTIFFVINDNVIYTALTDFKSAENRKAYSQLVNMRDDSKKLLDLLNVNRQKYSIAKQAEKQDLKAKILQQEKKMDELERTIHQLEKTIRNRENQLLM